MGDPRIACVRILLAVFVFKYKAYKRVSGVSLMILLLSSIRLSNAVNSSNILINLDN